MVEIACNIRDYSMNERGKKRLKKLNYYKKTYSSLKARAKNYDKNASACLPGGRWASKRRVMKSVGSNPVHGFKVHFGR